MFEARAILWNNESVSNEIIQKEPIQSVDSKIASAAINGHARAETPLSEREMDVAKLLVTGATNNEIADQLIISPHTVKVHLRNIYEKLGVGSRTEASTLLLQNGWVVLPGLEAPSLTEITVPEPLPLGNLVGRPFGWQPIFLLAAMVLSVGLLLLPPFLRQQITAGRSLLTDATTVILSQPDIEVLPRWELRTPLPVARSRFPLVSTHDGRLFAIGGEGVGGQILTAVTAYNLAVNEWQPVALLPFALSNHAAAVWEDAIYVAGGTTTGESDGEALSLSQTLLRYDIGANEWKPWVIYP